MPPKKDKKGKKGKGGDDGPPQPTIELRPVKAEVLPPDDVAPLSSWTGDPNALLPEWDDEAIGNRLLIAALFCC